MGRSIDHRNNCLCGGKYLDSNKSRHETKSDKHLNWLAMQSSVQKQYQQECSPVNGQQNIMTNEQLIQFKQQMEWYNNYIYEQQVMELSAKPVYVNEEIIDNGTINQSTTD